ncbi:MAG: 50S ribosomal protein L29 [Acidimicrobiales bacterium]
MANAAAAELRDLPEEELRTRLVEAREELFNLRFQLVTGQLDNTARVGNVRRQLARIQTELRQREIAPGRARTTDPDRERENG